MKAPALSHRHTWASLSDQVGHRCLPKLGSMLVWCLQASNEHHSTRFVWQLLRTERPEVLPPFSVQFMMADAAGGKALVVASGATDDVSSKHIDRVLKAIPKPSQP
eukprot:6729116-Alexandrium_andersonii.AAC.2